MADPAELLDIDKIFYRDLHRQFVIDMLRNTGDFLLRTASGGGIVLSVNHKDEIMHFKFRDHQRVYRFQYGPAFGSLSDLINFHYRTQGIIVDEGTKLLNPIKTKFEMIDPNRIKMEKQLGAGNVGQVWEGKLSPAKPGEKEETVAIKTFGHMSQSDRQECLTEARIMTLIDHENIVKFKGISVRGLPQLQMIMELCNAGSLDKLLETGELTEEDKARALLDAAKGVAYLHERDLIHRDIKSRNCLVHEVESRKTIKIAEFGLYKMTPENYDLTPPRKLPIFTMPPEALLTREWTKQSDVWAFGVLIMEMYNRGLNPNEQYYNSQKMEDMKTWIKFLKDGKRVDPPADMPPELVEVVKKCTQKNNRPTMDAVVKTLTEFCSKDDSDDDDD